MKRDVSLYFGSAKRISGDIAENGFLFSDPSTPFIRDSVECRITYLMETRGR